MGALRPLNGSVTLALIYKLLLLSKYHAQKKDYSSSLGNTAAFTSTLYLKQSDLAVLRTCH